MWPFAQNDDVKNELDKVKQERDSVLSALKDLTSKYEETVADIKGRFIDFSVKSAARESALLGIAEHVQGNVIPGGRSIGSGEEGSYYTSRYRNGSAESPPADVHRLEWIAKASAYDPTLLAAASKTEADMTGDYASDLPYMWAEGWKPVVGGEAVVYTP